MAGCSLKKGHMLLTRRIFNALIFILVVIYLYLSINFNMREASYLPKPATALTEHIKSITNSLRGNGNHSNAKQIKYLNKYLGREYKLVDIPEVKSNTSQTFSNKTHVILWYNKPGWIKLSTATRLLRDRCPYNNCKMTSNHGNLTDKSAIVFCLTETLHFTPPTDSRPEDQVWIVFWMEAPRKIESLNVNLLAFRHNSWRHTVNWTMSYRTDSDIVFPYGSLVSVNDSFKKNYGQIYNRKRKFAAWFVSNCYTESGRDGYVNELKDHGIHVDIYGRCGKENKRRGQGELTEMLDNDYKFYFAFENSFCQDYVTEKVFRNYNRDIIIVVRGGANYSNLLPPKTFINTADFNSTYDFVQYLKYVSNDRKTYINYLREKDKYASSEMFQMTTSYCRMCEKLNHLEENRRKVIPDIVDMLHDDQCEHPVDLNTYHSIVTGYFTWSNIIMGIVLTVILTCCYFLNCKSR